RGRGGWGACPERSRRGEGLPHRSRRRLAAPDLLYHPAVAVGGAEGEERAIVAALWIGPRRPLARLEVARLAGIHPAFDQLGTRGLDVGDDQVQPLDGARRSFRDPLPDTDRARRPRRRHLDDAELIAGAVVDVQIEADLFDVEGLGAVHV